MSPHSKRKSRFGRPSSKTSITVCVKSGKVFFKESNVRFNTVTLSPPAISSPRLALT